jgi:hypothetical protein
MIDKFSIGQFTVDGKAAASIQPRWTFTIGQFRATRPHFTRAVRTEQEEKKRPKKLLFVVFILACLNPIMFN